MPIRRDLTAIVASACILLSLSGRLGAADRDARVITPNGSPVWLDPWRALLFFDSPGASVILQNRHSATVTWALRVWVFDSDWRLRGSADYCTSEVLDRNTRRQLFVPLDIRGIAALDRAVVTISVVQSGRAVWTLRESEADQLRSARAAAQGSSAQLTMDSQESQAAWVCPCEAITVGAVCSERCADTGLVTHQATVLPDTGCSASCTCR